MINLKDNKIFILLEMINGNGSSSHSMDTAIDNSEHSLSDKTPSSPRPGANRRGSKSGKRRTGINLLNYQFFIDIFISYLMLIYL